MVAPKRNMTFFYLFAVCLLHKQIVKQRPLRQAIQFKLKVCVRSVFVICLKSSKEAALKRSNKQNVLAPWVIKSKIKWQWHGYCRNSTSKNESSLLLPLPCRLLFSISFKQNDFLISPNCPKMLEITNVAIVKYVVF